MLIKPKICENKVQEMKNLLDGEFIGIHKHPF